MEKAKQAGKDSIIECDSRQTITKHIAEKNGFIYGLYIIVIIWAESWMYRQKRYLMLDMYLI